MKERRKAKRFIEKNKAVIHYLYGYGVQTKKKKPARIDDSIPVEVTEI